MDQEKRSLPASEFTQIKRILPSTGQPGQSDYQVIYFPVINNLCNKGLRAFQSEEELLAQILPGARRHLEHKLFVRLHFFHAARAESPASCDLILRRRAKAGGTVILVLIMQLSYPLEACPTQHGKQRVFS